MRAYFDTNVLVASLKAEHPHHAASFAATSRVHRGEVEGCIAAQSLAELYSVLTRAPFDLPVYPDEALLLINETIVPFFRLIEVTAQSHIAAIAMCAGGGWKGGRVHDAVHVQAAMQAECDVIYTFDLAHLRALAPDWSSRIQNPPPQ